MPSVASVWHAGRDASQIGSFTTMFGAMAARRRPSATISSVVSAVDSAETGMSLQISQILAM